jgi:hypothetical protein
MAVPLWPGYPIKVRNKLRLTLIIKGVFKSVKRRYKIIKDRNNPLA